MSAERLYLIGSIAGRRVAIDTAQVDSVIDLTAIQPVPGAAPGILGLAALRSRVLTVVDCAVALGLGAESPGGDAPLATVVMEIGGYLYGLVLDRIDDVLTADHPLKPAGAPLGGPWSSIAVGIVEVAGSMLPVVEPAAILAAMPARAA